ncbi:sugar ABC transporter [Klebsiella indica]|uniref:sugar ABC transporter n=1 Tax=Klebsiella TaxID=570 RepID=UPI0011578281|nr:sugar ABC transporter [Klebsiella sp. 2680]
MLYLVECTYADRESETRWNAFYNQQKLPALVSVNGFSASQRFKALSSGCPVYLAIHTIKDADVITCEEYQRKGGGNFSHWQQHIRDWHRNLYQYAGSFPAVAVEEVLLLSLESVDFIDAELGYRPTILQAAGLDKNPPQRVAYILPRREASLVAAREKAWIYEPITSQLRSHADKQSRSR